MKDKTLISTDRLNATRAYVTLLSSQNYLKGVLVLNYSLKKVGSKYSLLVLLSPNMCRENEKILETLNSHHLNYKILNQSFTLPDNVSQKVHSRRWINTFDKLQVFGLTTFEKIVFLDSDMLIVKNIDHLFEKPHLTFATASEQVSGCEDWILPNSGMMVIEPENDLPEKIFNIWPQVQSKKSDFSDQDLIHQYFAEIIQRDQQWRVPAIYNCFVFLIDKICKERKYNLEIKTPNSQTISVLHFAIKDRPWMMRRNEKFKFYFSRVIKGKLNELKAYKLFFNYLAAIQRESI